MADENPSLTASVFQIKRAPNPARPMFYVNNAQVMANQWDVQLYFSLVHEVNPGEFAAVDAALIIMTPEHALALSKALQNTLEGYVKQQGEIRDIKPVTLPIPGKS